jgi:nucleoside-diphosphate-sugar epimerase
MKILITGCSGYVGYVLSRFFSSQGIRVVGLDINDNPVWDGNKQFQFYSIDVRDKNVLATIFAKEKPTHVIHLAFLMDPLHDAQKQYDIDVNGSMNVLRIANNTASVTQFVQFSSASAYGAWKNNPLWIQESQPLRPRDYRYGLHKAEIERRFLSQTLRKNFKLVILRMCTAVGPRYHKSGGVVSLLANAKVLPKFGGEYAALQFIHEEDLTALIEYIINDARIEGIYNLAPDSYATTKDLVAHKHFIPVPVGLARGLVKLLWSLRLIGVRPAAIRLSAYGIVINPMKLMKRYSFTFTHSTRSAFQTTVDQRRNLGTL